MEELSEEDRRALRGSKFAPLPPNSLGHARSSRLPHPGGPLTTNKAAALAKFLERKLQEPGSLRSLDPEIVERAVRNAQAAVNAGKHGPETSHRLQIRHVDSFSDSDIEVNTPSSPQKEMKMKNKDKLKSVMKSNGAGVSKKTKKKLQKEKKMKKKTKLKLNK